MFESVTQWMIHVNPKETMSHARVELLWATGLLVLAMATIYMGVPILSVPLFAVGVLLALASGANYRAAARAVRARADAERAELYAREVRARLSQADIDKLFRDDVRLLFRSWADGKPTTKRAAEEMGVPQERWEVVVAYAVKNDLGVRVPTHGGNKMLKITADRKALWEAAGRV